jgi:hypothetical protein
MVLAGSVVQAGNAEPGQSGIQDVQQPASPVVSEADEALLKERVLARWQALIKGDFEVAYQFETPAYRAVYTPDQFRYQFGNQTLWRMANVMNIHYDDPIVARVQVEVAYRYAEPEKGRGTQSMTHQVGETWLHKEGQWWRQQD